MYSESSYWVLKINNVPESLEDELTSLLFELGASGVQEDLAFEQKDKKFMPEVVSQTHKSLLVYFESQPVKAVGQIISNNYPELRWQIEKKATQDWQSEWKKSWQPFALTSSCWVVPTWMRETFDKPKVDKIYIDPGMAFGTGTHATTQLASELISDLCSEQNIATAVDVGTGSGILAILLEASGVKDVAAFDNDPEAERVFNDNLGINGCSRLTWDSQWEKNHEGFDLVVANIIDGVLLSLKPQFQQVVKPGGWLIFTGVLKEREQEFLREMTQQWPLELQARIEKEEWVGFLFKENA